jgi:uncharacterized surface protein with fasciclin (FAS1) repeats
VFPGCTFFEDSVLEKDADFSILKQALAVTGLNATLANLSTPVTVFAPTNEAFAEALSMLNVTFTQLLASPGLTDLLLYHVSPVVFTNLTSFMDGESIPTLIGGSDNLTVSFANATEVGITSFASEGTLLSGYGQACQILFYPIDVVLIPEALLYGVETELPGPPQASVVTEAAPASPTAAFTAVSQSEYVVNGPQGPCSCTLGPPGSYNASMRNPTVAEALMALGPARCPTGANGNTGVGNTGGSGNTGCYNSGTGNSGDNNSGTANTGAQSTGTGNTGFCLNGTGMTGNTCAPRTAAG